MIKENEQGNGPEWRQTLLHFFPPAHNVMLRVGMGFGLDILVWKLLAKF